MGFVGRNRVKLDDQGGGLGIRVDFPFDFLYGIRDERFDLEQAVRVDRAAELVANLKAVVRARVM